MSYDFHAVRFAAGLSQQAVWSHHTSRQVLRRLTCFTGVAGAIASLSASASASEILNYSYDAVGRLVQVSHSGPINQGASASYQYDRADNRTNVVATTPWTSRASRTGDFNGDGFGDLLWRNYSDAGYVGVVTDWLSSSSGSWTDNWGNAAAWMDTAWKMNGVGDLNGDGRSDILWRNDNGTIGEWLGQSNGGFSGNANVAYVVSTDWKIAGVADFDGDGRADILWRNDNGAVAEWLAQAGGTFVGNPAVNSAVGTQWKVAGVGDFNDDGRADILWRNDIGTVTDWLAQSNGGFIGNDSNVNITVGTDWHIVGTGDFNGDGRSDILWRNDNGQLTEWQGTAAGGFVTVGMPGYAIPTNYRVALIGDFNGDHYDDILLQDPAGNVVEWIGQAGGNFTANGSGNAAGSSTWNIEPR